MLRQRSHLSFSSSPPPAREASSPPQPESISHAYQHCATDRLYGRQWLRTFACTSFRFCSRMASLFAPPPPFFPPPAAVLPAPPALVPDARYFSPFRSLSLQSWSEAVCWCLGWCCLLAHRNMSLSCSNSTADMFMRGVSPELVRREDVLFCTPGVTHRPCHESGIMQGGDCVWMIGAECFACYG